MSIANPANMVDKVPVEVSLREVKPSPENDEIYGAVDPTNAELIDLANDIISDGIREPLRVSADGYIVSGHRRYAAASLAQLQAIPVVYLDLLRADHDATQWKQVLRSYNHQRVKSRAVRMRETMLDIDPNIAHRQLIAERDERKRDTPPTIKITGEKNRSGISARKMQFLDAAVAVVNGLDTYWPLSVRQVHYGLLNDPPLLNSSTGKQRARYANDRKSYQALCDLLGRARLNGAIPFAAISDTTRPRSGTYYHPDASTFAGIAIDRLLRGYRRDLLQSQSDHVELIVEKLTVRNIVEPIAKKYCVPMTIGRGYCSIDPRHDIVQRYHRSAKDRLILLIASDFDPDGNEIAESLARSIRDDFGVDHELLGAHKVLLREDQIRDWSLPPNRMEAKPTSAQYRKFMERYGSSEVHELEAVPPERMQSAISDAIEAVIDLDAFNEEIAAEQSDAVTLQAMKTEAAEAFSDMFKNESND